MSHFPATITITVALALSTSSPSPAADVDFHRDVRPILVKHCVACHGPRSHKAGLRLDAATLIHKGGESGRAVVAKQPAQSLLLTRLTTNDPALRMPAEAKPLSNSLCSVAKGFCFLFFFLDTLNVFGDFFFCFFFFFFF